MRFGETDLCDSQLENVFTSVRYRLQIVLDTKAIFGDTDNFVTGLKFCIIFFLQGNNFCRNVLLRIVIKRQNSQKLELANFHSLSK